MPKRLVVRDVSQVEWLDGWAWSVAMEDPDLSHPRGYGFPADVFEWRAAEYELDLQADFETLLDMVLYSPFIPDPLEPANFGSDAAFMQGLRGKAVKARGSMTGAGDAVPPHLFNTETAQVALEAQLVRVEHVKKNLLEIGPATVSLQRGVITPEDPLDKLRNAPQPHPESLALKRHMVKGVRAKHLAEIERVSNQPKLFASSPRPSIRPFPATRQDKIDLDPSAVEREKAQPSQE